DGFVDRFSFFIFAWNRKLDGSAPARGDVGPGDFGNLVKSLPDAIVFLVVFGEIIGTIDRGNVPGRMIEQIPILPFLLKRGPGAVLAFLAVRPSRLALGREEYQSEDIPA